MKVIETQTINQAGPRSPFRGIRPFRFIDQEYYCGRTELIEELSDKVVLYRLVVLFGESGCGKSSLLNAGLVPALKKKGYQPERLRVRPFTEQPFLIERIEAGADSGGEYLPSIFAPPENDGPAPPSLTLPLDDFHRAIRAAVNKQHPVLIFDQFEELFTLFGHEKDSRASMAQRDLQLKLLDTITGLANDTQLKVKIVLTIREDFLGKLQVVTGEYPQVLDHRIRLGLLTQDTARESILNPFKEPNRFLSRFTGDLADVIVEQLLSTESDRTIPPTQLQIVCSRLWDEYASKQSEIDVAEFNQMGQVKGILKEFLASELELLDSPLREPAVRVLGNLVTDSNTRDVVSEEKIRSLLGSAHVPNEVLSTVLKSLEARRLINQVAQRGTYYFELSSEFLIEPIQKEVRQIEHKQELERAQLEQAKQKKKTIWAVTTAGILFVFLLLALVAGGYAYIQKGRAEASEKQSRQLRYHALMTLAHQDLLSGNFARVVRSLNASLPDPRDAKQDDLRTFSWYYLWRRSHRERATLSGHTSPINSVVFSPDGRTLATASDDKTVKLWDANTREELATLANHAEAARAVAFSPDGKMLASASDDGSVKVWDVNTRRELAALSGQPMLVRSVAFSADGKTLASAGLGDADQIKTVRIWNTENWTERTLEPAKISNVMSVAFSRDGKWLAASGNQGIELWDIVAGRKVGTLKSHKSYVLSIAFSHDSKMLASGSADKDVKLWNIETRALVITLTGHISDVRAVTFSPKDNTIASASLDGTLKLWDVGSGKLLVTLSGHSLGILSAAFSPDGNTLISGSRDNTVKFWDAGAREEIDLLPRQSQLTYSIAFSPDSRKLAVAFLSGNVKVWDAATRQELTTLDVSGSANPSVAFSPDGKMLAAAAKRTVKVWETDSWRELATITVINEPAGKDEKQVNAVAFSYDGRYLASGSHDFKVKLWDIATWQEAATFDHKGGGVLSVAFSPDGKTLASAGYDRTVKLWDLNTRKELVTLRQYSQAVLSLDFSPDGKVLASGDFEGNVKLWEVASWKELATLIGHVQGVLSVAFSPDGKTLASASYDRTVRLWDIETGQQLATLTEASTSIYSVAFSPNGRSLAAAGGDKQVTFWIAATNEDVERQMK